MWAWNKVALLQKVLKETPPERAPWILYMQPDTIIDDIAFTFPFEMYQDKHWVSVGNAESVLNGWASGEPLTFASSLHAQHGWLHMCTPASGLTIPAACQARATPHVPNGFVPHHIKKQW